MIELQPYLHCLFFYHVANIGVTITNQEKRFGYMRHQLAGILVLATRIFGSWHKVSDSMRLGKSGRGHTGWIFLILMGLFMTSPSTIYGQVDPATLNPVSGRSNSIEEIIPADVLARVELLRDELELIRFEMGAPKEPWPKIVVTNVAPREVIFQAFTLLRKANTLRFEITGGPRIERQLKLPPDIQPFHVWTVVDAAYRVVHGAKQILQITEPVEETLQDESVTPSEVFQAIVQANQQFDALYRRRLSAAETFHQMMVATQITAQLLAEFSGTTQMPNIPAFEHGKRPVDVYFLLNKCYARIHAILEYSGIEALTLQIPNLKPNDDDSANIRASDVYDLTILLVSELAYLQGQLKDTVPANQQAYARGFKVPSHVYQRGKVLLSQLVELETRVSENPDWLTRKRSHSDVNFPVIETVMK